MKMHNPPHPGEVIQSALSEAAWTHRHPSRESAGRQP